MRKRFTFIGTGLLATTIAVGLLAHSPHVSGDSTQVTDVALPSEFHDPFTPYPLGSGAITYERQNAAEQDATDAVRRTIVGGQQASSVDEWSNAAAESASRAAAIGAAQRAGLENTAQDGVVP